jgi:hypothetical protein
MNLKIENILMIYIFVCHGKTPALSISFKRFTDLISQTQSVDDRETFTRNSSLLTGCEWGRGYGGRGEGKGRGALNEMFGITIENNVLRYCGKKPHPCSIT